jgi:hypothetical protein
VKTSSKTSLFCHDWLIKKEPQQLWVITAAEIRIFCETMKQNFAVNLFVR